MKLLCAVGTVPLAVLLVVAGAGAGCAGDCCGGPPAAPASPLLSPAEAVFARGLHWVGVPGHPEQAALYDGPWQLGAWNHEKGRYFAFDPLRRLWAAEGRRQAPLPPPAAPPGVQCPCPCGCEPPCSCGTEPTVAVEENYGVTADRIQPGKLSLNGHAADRRQVLRALQSGAEGKQLPSKQGKVWAVAIGSEAQRRQLVGTLKASPHQDRLLIQEYGPQEWAVTQAGYRVKGDPTLYVQDLQGKVLHSKGGQPSPEEVEKVLSRALRKADPKYDPAKDPDLTKPSLLPDNVPGWVWAAGGVAVLFYLGKTNQQTNNSKKG